MASETYPLHSTPINLAVKPESVLPALARRIRSELRHVATVRDMSDAMATKVHTAKASALQSLFFELSGVDWSEVTPEDFR